MDCHPPSTTLPVRDLNSACNLTFSPSLFTQVANGMYLSWH
jgi:hypothetical protein